MRSKRNTYDHLDDFLKNKKQKFFNEAKIEKGECSKDAEHRQPEDKETSKPNDSMEDNVSNTSKDEANKIVKEIKKPITRPKKNCMLQIQ